MTFSSHDKPSVLIVCDQFPPMKGGIGDYTVLLANALIDQGVEVSLLVPEGSSHAGCRAPIAATYPAWSWSTLPHLHRTLMATRAQWIHLQHNGGLYANCRLAAYFLPMYLHWKRWPGRIAVTFHDVNPPRLFPKAGPLRDWVVSNLAKHADLAIAADTTDVARLRARGAVVHQIPIGSNIPISRVGSESSQAIRARYGIPADHFLVGHFGTSLGLDTLFEAVANMSDTTLLLIGKTEAVGTPGAIDQLPPALRSQLTALGIGPRVRWTSHLAAEAVADALAACDMIVLPYPGGASLRHGGLVAAINQGRAVVTTTPKTPLVGFDTGNSLVIVPPCDAPALLTAMNEVRLDPARNLQLEHAATTARESFTWETIAREHARLYTASRHASRS